MAALTAASMNDKLPEVRVRAKAALSAIKLGEQE
jgi:hypothetical protein